MNDATENARRISAGLLPLHPDVHYPSAHGDGFHERIPDRSCPFCYPTPIVKRITRTVHDIGTGHRAFSSSGHLRVISFGKRSNGGPCFTAPRGTWAWSFRYAGK